MIKNLMIDIQDVIGVRVVEDVEMTAEVTIRGILDMQVCVPADWSDDQVKEFADRENFCGSSHGWFIRRKDDNLLKGDPERQPCASRVNHVHIMLDA
jgi:hypothetical protein